jgi:hypothetical protein
MEWGSKVISHQNAMPIVVVTLQDDYLKKEVMLISSSAASAVAIQKIRSKLGTHLRAALVLQR